MKAANIYIDNSNLLYTLKNMSGNLDQGGKIVDYFKMIEYIKSSCNNVKINKIFLVDGIPSNDKHKQDNKIKFVHSLKHKFGKSGYNFNYELIEIFSHNDVLVQKGIDTDICINIVEDSIIDKSFDTVILISGDLDFMPVINKVKKYKKDFIVSFFNESISNKLKISCDKYIELDLNKIQ